ncbi:MAG: Trk system potassium transporter TrkA [Spirochaetaceae bacterium]|nr:Trk system potassium transporter TrkA [Spirochaetaceae bacterium]
MKIIIIGAGFTGLQLAKRLIADKNDVVLVEKDAEKVRHASNRLDCMVVEANGNSLEVLEEVGIAKADVLIALTESDELNMITCSLVDSVYPQVKKIARVRNYDYYADLKRTKTKNQAKGTDVATKRPTYGIDFMVHPDVEAAEAIISAVEHGALAETIDFDDSNFELTQIVIRSKSKLAGCSLKDIHSLTTSPFVIAFIEKKGQPLLPSGNTILDAGDRIGILAQKENLAEFFTLCGSEINKLRRIVLVGAGRIGTLIAEGLLEKKETSLFSKFLHFHKKANQDFVIVDSDAKRAKEASEKFPSANVFCADITDDGFIAEENLQNYDLFIASTHNHELNMIASAYVKSLGIDKTIALVASSAYSAISRRIGIDVAIPIKDAVVDTIMSHLRGESVKDLHTISAGKLEILKIQLPEKNEVEGKALKDIALPGVFLALLMQKKDSKEFVIPKGDTILNKDDTWIIITFAQEAIRILDFFGVVS